MDVTQFISALESALPLFPGLTQTPPTLSSAVAQKPLPSSGHPAAHLGVKNFEAFLASAVQQVDATTPASSRLPAELARLPSIVDNTKSNADAKSAPPLSVRVAAFSPALLTKAILNKFPSLPAPATNGIATPAVLEDQPGPAVGSPHGSEVKTTKAEEVVPPEPPLTNLLLLPPAKLWRVLPHVAEVARLPSIVSTGVQIPDDGPAETQPGGPVIPPATMDTIGPANQSVVADKEDHWQLAPSSGSLNRLPDPVVVASLSLPAVALDAIPHAKMAGGANLAASLFPPRQVPANPDETAIPAAVVNPAIVANTMPTKLLSLKPLDKGKTGSLLPMPPTHRPQITAGKPSVAPVSGLPEDIEQSVKELPVSMPPPVPIAVSEIAPSPAAAGLGTPSPIVRENRPGVVLTGQGNVRSMRFHAAVPNFDGINVVTTNVLPTATGMTLPVVVKEKPTMGTPPVPTFFSIPTSLIDVSTNVSPPTADRTAGLSPPVRQENSVAKGKTDQAHDVAHTALPTLPVPIVVTADRSDRIHAVPSPNDSINPITTNYPQPVPKLDLLVPVATPRPAVGQRDTVGDRVTTSGSLATSTTRSGTRQSSANAADVLATSVGLVERPATPPISPMKIGATCSLLPVPPTDEPKNTGGKPQVALFSGQVEDFQQAPMAIHTVIDAAPDTSEGPGGVSHQPHQSGAPEPSNNWLRDPNLTAATVEEAVQKMQKPAVSPPLSSPSSVKPSEYSPAAYPGKTALPAKPAQPEGSQLVEQVADYPEESLQALPHPAATFAAKVLAFAHGITSADKTNKFEPTEPGTQSTKDLPAVQANDSSLSPLHTLAAPNVLQGGDHAMTTGQAPGAVDKIAHAIASQAETLGSEGHTTLHLQLDPPGLGSVRVHLSASDHAVSARLVVQDESTRQILESQVGLLRDKLLESGITLGKFAVTRDGGRSPGKDQQAPDSWSPALRRFSGEKSPNGGTSARPNGPRGVIDVIA